MFFDRLKLENDVISNTNTRVGNFTRLRILSPLSVFDRRSPISIAAAVIYIITQLSDDKKLLKGQNILFGQFHLHVVL